MKRSSPPTSSVPANLEGPGHEQFHGALGQSRAMRQIFGTLQQIAPTDATVLLLGETGTGKDVLARAIVDASPRRDKPFVVADCGAMSYSLIESELFGHERGAFTGAVDTRQGAFELAGDGTVLLDEIGELPLDIQPKLLRVIETREYRRVGGNRTLRTEARILAATKRDLDLEVKEGKFREDLFYRLAVVPILVPPLRERREDIEPLARAIAASGGWRDLDAETLTALTAHHWPGNVRQLRNVLERAIHLARATGKAELAGLLGLEPEDTGFQFRPGDSYRDARERFEFALERDYVRWLLGRHAGNISAAARAARMDRKYLGGLARKHGFRLETNLSWQTPKS